MIKLLKLFNFSIFRSFICRICACFFFSFLPRIILCSSTDIFYLLNSLFFFVWPNYGLTKWMWNWVCIAIDAILLKIKKKMLSDVVFLSRLYFAARHSINKWGEIFYSFHSLYFFFFFCFKMGNGNEKLDSVQKKNSYWIVNAENRFLNEQPDLFFACLCCGRIINLALLSLVLVYFDRKKKPKQIHNQHRISIWKSPKK